MAVPLDSSESPGHWTFVNNHQLGRKYPAFLAVDFLSSSLKDFGLWIGPMFESVDGEEVAADEDEGGISDHGGSPWSPHG